MVCYINKELSMELDRKCVSECIGCDHNHNDLCAKFLCPSTKIRVGKGDCGMATHMSRTRVQPEGKVRIGQQKQKRNKLKE